jgi:cellobiose phosphorylase
MACSDLRTFVTPRDGALGLAHIQNQTGLSVSVLPNSAIFTIAHEGVGRRIMINQVLGSPLCSGIGRLILRLGGPEPQNIEIAGPAARADFGVGSDRVVWAGETAGARHRVTLWLHREMDAWFWLVEAASDRATKADVVLVQDIGLGERGFLMNNEAYASQYIDHHIGRHADLGPVVMSRQNLAQGGRHPWVAHGCLEGAASFGTDALQLFGPAYRDAESIALPFGRDLPGQRLQHEVACAMIQSRPSDLAAGRTARWTFFGLYESGHPAASDDGDLDRVDAVTRGWASFLPANVALKPPARSLVQDATPVTTCELAGAEMAGAFHKRRHEEWVDGRLFSFFVPDGAHNRHVVLGGKERRIARRHGALLRSGQAMLPADDILCATAWMHGVFAAQLTIGNTSFHKLFSVSRDPYNITRASGVRMLIEIAGAWRLLAVPSAFDMGLSDCRWIYRLDDREVTVHVMASGEHAAMQWRIDVVGKPARFIVYGHLVLGERELEHAGRVMIDVARKRFSFRPDPAWLWGQRYPEAVYHFVTATPDEIEAIGGDELLYADGIARSGGYVALRTQPTTAFSFAVVGSMTSATEAERLAAQYEAGVVIEAMLAPAARFWSNVTRELQLKTTAPEAAAETAAIETVFPWFAHNAMMHLTVPHGLEQYSGAAWGTRDVCQGPVEFLLALEHDAPVKEILRIVFAEQYEQSGDWPQWFMLEPYSNIRDRHAHGDVIVWPLKALCDYVEATNDLAFLEEPAPWRRDSDFAHTECRDSIAAHVDKVIAKARARFIAGTHLIRYGEGDWNDSLQPADPTLRDRMVSSWTVALLFQQLRRYAEVQLRAGHKGAAAEIETLATAMAADFQRFLVRNGTVAGYAIFEPESDEPELLIHPSDRRTGLRYSLLPMTRGIIAGLFTPEQARHHLAIIREHLLFPDGARLMDRPVAYRGGPEKIFRRAESAAFFGREIGLMYVHSHLRYGEAMARLGEADAVWDALALANPISVTERLGHASARQRNAYFSSSDAAFPDRYVACTDWERVRAAEVPVDGGWRVYSSGPGLYANLLIRHALGLRRRFGERVVAPVLPDGIGELTLATMVEGTRRSWTL